MTNRMLLKTAMERQNAAARALLQLRNALVRDLRKTIPQEEKNQVCVVVSWKEFCTVRSFDADDYRIKTQANLICETFMYCKTVDELLCAVRNFVLKGSVWNGQRDLPIHNTIQKVLYQYAEAADVKNQGLSLVN